MTIVNQRAQLFIDVSPEPASAAPSSEPDDGLLVRPLEPDEPPLEASFSRQLKLVEIFLEQDKHLGSQLREGYYLVSTRWWNLWISTCRSVGSAGPGSNTRYTMKPVENSDLMDPYTGLIIPGLTPALDQGIQQISAFDDYVYVPRTVWENCFERW